MRYNVTDTYTVTYNNNLAEVREQTMGVAHNYEVSRQTNIAKHYYSIFFGRM